MVNNSMIFKLYFMNLRVQFPFYQLNYEHSNAPTNY